MCVSVAEFAKVPNYPTLENFICEEMSQHVEDTCSLWEREALLNRLDIKGQQIPIIIHLNKGFTVAFALLCDVKT